MRKASERGPRNRRSRRRLWLACLGVTALLAGSCRESPAAPDSATCRVLPEFTEQSKSAWINSAPLTRADLRGKVLLVDVWTFACWNCYRSFPWLRAVEKRLGDRGLQVVGIHTPEFKREKVRANVERHVRKYGLRHPVMMDNEFRYWRALGNRYWPTFYVVDRQGCIRNVFIGETHSGTAAARRIEAALERLL